ncbi:MAG: hypothetical protein ACFB9M_18125 [Myxococcota bacterium]
MRMVRRIASIACFALPLECAYSEAPRTSGLRAVRVQEAGRWVLTTVTREALRCRVRPGMSESEALARCPELEVRDRDFDRELLLLTRAAEAMMAFGPDVEVQGPGLLFVEYGRSQSVLAAHHSDEDEIARAMLLRLQRLGHDAAIAMTSNVETGRTLVQGFARRAETRILVVPEGDEATRIAHLPIMDLMWTDSHEDSDGRLSARLAEATRELNLLGIETVSELMQLEALPSRFSDIDVLLRRRVTVGHGRPLRVHEPSEHLVEDFELDLGTESIEPLLFIGKRLVDRLAVRLDGLSRSVVNVRLILRHEPSCENQLELEAPRPKTSQQTWVQELVFARPTRDPEVMFSVLRERIEVPGFVLSMRLEAISAQYDPGSQLDLFNRFAQRVEEAAGLVSRLQAALGSDAVFMPRSLDRHRPEAGWAPEPFDIETALTDSRPARPRQHGMMSLELPFSDDPRDRRSLPEVNDALSVIHGTTGPELRSTPEPGKAPKPWPKPVPRRAEDEPPLELPPRPVLLFARPRRVSLSSDGTFHWEGELYRPVESEEPFESEWWSSQPLFRTYRVYQGPDGRRIWAFRVPDCSTRSVVHLHGVFD